MQSKKQVKVGIDILDLQFAKTGQKTILEEYYRQFQQNQDSSIVFFPLTAKLPQFSGSSKWGIIANHLVYHFWKQVLLPIKAKKKGVDLVFCCDYFSPIIRLGFKNVVFFHDAFFYEYPTHYNRLWLQLFKRLAIPAARSAACIITTTEYAKQKIHAHFGFPLAQIINIYPGPKTMKLDKDEKISTEPYILHVGVWEKRKNIPFLLKAYKRFLETSQLNYALVLVGEGNQKKHSDDTNAIKQCIQELGLENRVICTGYISDDALAKVYQGASLYVFPSYNEGFGIPILEAFQHHVPVLVANNSCLPEVGGDAVRGFDPHDINELATLMQQVLTNEELKQSLIEKGHQRLQLFSWEKASEALINIFKKAAHGNP